MAIAGNIRIEFSLPNGVEFVSIHSKYDGGWAVCLKAAYEVLNRGGSSLGSTYGYGESGTVEAAYNTALQSLHQRLREQRDRPVSPRPTSPTSASKSASKPAGSIHTGSLSADDIFAVITKKG